MYRKAATAVVAAYLEMGDETVDAILEDRLDDYGLETASQRQRVRSSRRHTYLLSRECVLRYAGTAAESLLAMPDSEAHQTRTMGDTGGLGLLDDINVVLRVEEMLESCETMATSEETDAILTGAKRELCNYFNACAYELVRERLLPSVLDVGEALFRGETVTRHTVKASLAYHEDPQARAHRFP